MEEKFTKRILKIAVVGPESTGKSALSAALAKHYNTVFVREVARDYIDSLSRPYTAQDVENIARAQLIEENKMLQKATKLLVCDTSLLVTKIWHEHAYAEKNRWIDAHYSPNTYDLHLLMNIDLPWQPDKQREHPHLRIFFYNWYLSELQNSKATFAVISGLNEARLLEAIKHVDSLLNSKA